MTDDHGAPVGSLAEELTKLMGVVSGFAESVTPSDRDDESGNGESDGTDKTDHASTHTAHVADGSAACQVCPVCQVITFVRSTSPEVREHLASSAASLAAATRGLIDGLATQHADPGQRESNVENIDLSEDGQWD